MFYSLFSVNYTSKFWYLHFLLQFKAYQLTEYPIVTQRVVYHNLFAHNYFLCLYNSEKKYISIPRFSHYLKPWFLTNLVSCKSHISIINTKKLILFSIKRLHLKYYPKRKFGHFDRTNKIIYLESIISIKTYEAIVRI